MPRRFHEPLPPCDGVDPPTTRHPWTARYDEATLRTWTRDLTIACLVVFVCVLVAGCSGARTISGTDLETCHDNCEANEGIAFVLRVFPDGAKLHRSECNCLNGARFPL